jgi:hypothetical protein
MLDADELIRCSTYPKGFHENMLAEEAIFDFADLEKTKRYTMSVGCGHLLPDIESRHNFGCRTETSINTERARRRMRALEESEVEHYVGYYELEFGRVMTIRNDLYAVAVVWCPEHGNIEHANIILYPNGRDATKRQCTDARLEVRKALVRIARGPIRGVCTNDPKQEEALMSIPLPKLS